MTRRAACAMPAWAPPVNKKDISRRSTTMWKWLILALAVYALYRLFANDFLKKKKAGDAEDAAEMERQVAAGEMVRDPECGTYVAVDSAISVRDGEKVHYFCSYECRDKFLKRLEEGGRVLPPRNEE